MDNLAVFYLLECGVADQRFSFAFLRSNNSGKERKEESVKTPVIFLSKIQPLQYSTVQYRTVPSVDEV